MLNRYSHDKDIQGVCRHAAWWAGHYCDKVVLAPTPPPPPIPRNERQDEYRHKFTNLQSLDPRERTLDWFLQPSNPSEQSTQHRAERSCDTTWKSFYSQCSVFAKLTEKLRHFRVLKQRAALRKLAILRWLGKTNRDCHIVNSRANFAAHPLCRWQGGQKWQHLPDPGDGKVCGWWVGSRVISSGTIQLTLSLKYLFLQFTFMLSIDKYPVAAYIEHWSPGPYDPQVYIDKIIHTYTQAYTLLAFISFHHFKSWNEWMMKWINIWRTAPLLDLCTQTARTGTETQNQRGFTKS